MCVMVGCPSVCLSQREPSAANPLLQVCCSGQMQTVTRCQRTQEAEHRLVSIRLVRRVVNTRVCIICTLLNVRYNLIRVEGAVKPQTLPTYLLCLLQSSYLMEIPCTGHIQTFILLAFSFSSANEKNKYKLYLRTNTNFAKKISCLYCDVSQYFVRFSSLCELIVVQA